jgi:hypothetical protein
MKLVRELGLAEGRGPLPKSLLRACHEARLVGGLSISLGATPDEVVGALTHAMGGAASRLKVHDVRTGRPLVMELEWDGLREQWELEDVEGLVHNLNDLLREVQGVKALVVLGEWEDMLQLWAVERGALQRLLEARLLDDARNVVTLRRLVGG